MKIFKLEAFITDGLKCENQKKSCQLNWQEENFKEREKWLL